MASTAVAPVASSPTPNDQLTSALQSVSRLLADWEAVDAKSPSRRDISSLLGVLLLVRITHAECVPAGLRWSEDSLDIISGVLSDLSYALQQRSVPADDPLVLAIAREAEALNKVKSAADLRRDDFLACLDSVSDTQWEKLSVDFQPPDTEASGHLQGVKEKGALAGILTLVVLGCKAGGIRWRKDVERRAADGSVTRHTTFNRSVGTVSDRSFDAQGREEPYAKQRGNGTSILRSQESPDAPQAQADGTTLTSVTEVRAEFTPEVTALIATLRTRAGLASEVAAAAASKPAAAGGAAP